jgi:hypothetical protein
VPTDYATIQLAVNAVQGTEDALVRIDSNAIFTETVTATQSVAIEAGRGFSPIIQAVATQLRGRAGQLRRRVHTGLRRDPDGVRAPRRATASAEPRDATDRVVLVFNRGDVDATAVIEDSSSTTRRVGPERGRAAERRGGSRARDGPESVVTLGGNPEREWTRSCWPRAVLGRSSISRW